MSTQRDTPQRVSTSRSKWVFIGPHCQCHGNNPEASWWPTYIRIPFIPAQQLASVTLWLYRLIFSPSTTILTGIEERSAVPPTLDVDQEKTGGQQDESKTARHQDVRQRPVLTKGVERDGLVMEDGFRKRLTKGSYWQGSIRRSVIPGRVKRPILQWRRPRLSSASREISN